MLNNFYYKLTREQCEDLLKDKEFANKNGLLGLKIGNLTDDELTETFNFIENNFKDTFVYYEPTNKNGEILDIFDILHDDFYNSQFKRIVDYSKTYKELFNVSVLLYNGEEKSFLKEESFKESIKNFLNDKEASHIPILFYIKDLDSINWIYGYLQEVTELSLISHNIEELYDFSEFQDYMCQITTKDLPPLSRIIHDSVVGHGWLARRSTSKVLFTIYPKQNIKKVTESAFLALRNTLSSELHSPSFVLDLGFLDLNDFKTYLNAFEEKYNQLQKKEDEIEELFKQGEYEKAREESKKLFIRRNSAGIFDGLEDYEYDPDIVFYSFGVGLPGGSRTVYSINVTDSPFKRYIFNYKSSWSGIEITRRKSEEEYQKFLEELKNVTKNWTETSYFKQAYDGYHEEIKCKDINLEVNMSNDHPEDYGKFKKVLSKHFEFDNSDSVINFKNVVKYIGMIIIAPFFFILDFLYDIYFDIKWWLKRKIEKIKQKFSKEEKEEKSTGLSYLYENKTINGINLEDKSRFLFSHIAFGKYAPAEEESTDSYSDKIYLVGYNTQNRYSLFLGKNRLKTIKLNALLRINKGDEVVIFTDDFSKFDDIKEIARIANYHIKECEELDNSLKFGEKTLFLCKNKDFIDFLDNIKNYEKNSKHRFYNGSLIVENFNDLEPYLKESRGFSTRPFETLIGSESFSKSKKLMNNIDSFAYFVLCDNESVEDYKQATKRTFELITLNSNELAVCFEQNEPVIAEDVDLKIFNCYNSYEYSKLKKY